MAIIRRSLESIKQSKPSFDREAIEAATESDIARYDREDEADAVLFPQPRDIRASLKMTQVEFAAALQVPLATLQNWEQGRVQPDPAARALLTIVSRDAQTAFRALDSSRGLSEIKS